MPRDCKIFWVDVETTGRDAANQEIIELACIVDINGKEVDRNVWYPRPDLWDNISEESLEIIGVTVEDLKQRELSQHDFVRELIIFLKKFVDPKDKWDFLTPGGQNTKFDAAFIDETFKRVFGNQDVFGMFFGFHYLDTSFMGISSHYLNPKWEACFYGLGKTAAAFGIERNEESEHGAAYDIDLTRKLFRKGIGADEKD